MVLKFGRLEVVECDGNGNHKADEPVHRGHHYDEPADDDSREPHCLFVVEFHLRVLHVHKNTPRARRGAMVRRYCFGVCQKVDKKSP